MRLLLLATVGCVPGIAVLEPIVLTDTGDTDTDVPVQLEVVDELATCDIPDGGAADVPVALDLVAWWSGSRVEAIRYTYAEGCCPQFEGTAGITGEDVRVFYGLQNDLCDCICSLNLAYAIEGMPSGTWRITDGDAEAWVTVP
ncbi:MAG: hypothetical protein H6736_17970 [Alphaproteobacteria bacterium]|nr:hypothetical protein [Alphaproteobacteria bacterium]